MKRTNQVANGLHKMNYCEVTCLSSCIMPLVFPYLCVSLTLNHPCVFASLTFHSHPYLPPISLPPPISHHSPGWKGPSWSSGNPAQPERPHRDPQHPPAAEEPGCAGQKPVWSRFNSCVQKMSQNEKKKTMTHPPHNLHICNMGF